MSRQAVIRLYSDGRFRSIFNEIGNKSFKSICKRRAAARFRKTGDHVQTPWKPEEVGEREG